MRQKMTPEAKAAKAEVGAKGFEMFSAGKLNTRTPHNWNWCTGYAITPIRAQTARLNNHPRLPLSTINGQRVISD